MIVRLLPILLVACLAHAATVDRSSIHSRHLARHLLSKNSLAPQNFRSASPMLTGADFQVEAWSSRLAHLVHQLQMTVVSKGPIDESTSTAPVLPVDDKQTVKFQGEQGYDLPGNTIATESCDHYCCCHFKCMDHGGAFATASPTAT